MMSRKGCWGLAGAVSVGAGLFGEGQVVRSGAAEGGLVESVAV